MIKRNRIDNRDEMLILSYMIMNKEVISTAYNRYKSGQLKTKHFAEHFRPVFRWAISYYAKYHEPPKRTIQKIFEDKKKNLNKDDIEIMDEYLGRLAKEFAYSQEEAIDPLYICRDVLFNFIREREISVRLERAQDKIERGRYKEAEKIISTYIPLIEEEDDEDKNLGTIIPYAKEDVLQHEDIDKSVDRIFKFNGDLHQMVGWLRRTWLVAITATEKTGKSYFLQEMAFQAAVYQKKRVLIINLELGKNIVRDRLRRRISLTTNKEDAGKAIWPVLDCENNQNGTCRILKQKRNRTNLFEDSISAVNFTERRRWRVCTKCKDNISIRRNASSIKRFIPTIWFEEGKLRSLTKNRIKKAIEEYCYLPVSNLRVKCFPRFSVAFDEVRNYIYRYIDKTKWEPHIIIFDYLDILAPEGKNIQERTDVDIKWKKAAQMAGEMNCLVLTADQATKAGRSQYALDQMSTSESKTKDAHLDIRIAINQTDSEKELNIARIGVLFHRHATFNVKHEVLITQRLATAEPITDNVRILHRGKKYRVFGIKNT